MKPAVVNGRWTVQMTDAQADWDVWAVWEKERFASMADHLKPGDVLFDVGAEFGSISAVYAQMVGGENMVLFEPSPVFWPGIRQTWEANGLATPRGCWAGLVGAEEKGATEKQDYDGDIVNGWPACAWSDTIHDTAAYRYLFNGTHATPQTRLDEFAADIGVAPVAITIDVEGAELAVLEGADRLLVDYRPLVFCSVHPDLMLRDFGIDDGLDAVNELLWAFEYDTELLAVDHEHHLLATPR